MKKSVSDARKTIGFQCIFQKDVDRQRRISGARDENEARLFVVEEFLQCEMKVKDIFKEMKVDDIFPPAKENWDTLYVKFASERSVHTLYRYSKYLQKNQRLVPYIPNQFYPRYRELENLTYNIRHGDYKYKTRVMMGTTDLILYKRKFNERYWSAVQPPHASLTIDQPAQSPSHEQRRSNNEDSTSPTFARHQQAVYRADPIQFNLRIQKMQSS